MKRLLATNVIVLFTTVYAMGQSPCTNTKVISPAVAKPAEGSIVSSTCSTLVVQWQGAANQTYTANVSSYNTVTNKWDTTYAAGTCNSSQQCTATLPVSAGTKVSWSVQAQQVVNGRTLYSYYLIGERDYPIPGCITVNDVTKTEAQKSNAVSNNKSREVPSAKNELLIFPNPAANEVTIQWNSEYKGTAVLAINDAAGKEVRMLRIVKEGAGYTNRIPISTLVAGLYYVQLKPQGGQAPLTGRFLKQ